MSNVGFLLKTVTGRQISLGVTLSPIALYQERDGVGKNSAPRSPPQEIPHAFLPVGKFLLRSYRRPSPGLWAGLFLPIPSCPLLSHKVPAPTWPSPDSPDRTPSCLWRERWELPAAHLAAA